MNKLVVIVIADTYEHLNRCLDSLLRQEYKASEVYAVFKEQNRNIAGIIGRYKGSIIAFPARGYSKAVEDILSTSKPDLFSVVGSEMVFDKDWLSISIAALEENADSMTVSDAALLDQDGVVVAIKHNFVTPDAIAMANYFGSGTNHVGLLKADLYSDNLPYLAIDKILPEKTAILADPLYGDTNSTARSDKIKISAISRHYLKSSMSYFSQAAAQHKTRGEEWEEAYIVIYSAMIAELLKNFRLLGALKMLLMATYTPGYRKKVLRNVKSSKRRSLLDPALLLTTEDAQI